MWFISYFHKVKQIHWIKVLGSNSKTKYWENIILRKFLSFEKSCLFDTRFFLLVFKSSNTKQGGGMKNLRNKLLGHISQFLSPFIVCTKNSLLLTCGIFNQSYFPSLMFFMLHVSNPPFCSLVYLTIFIPLPKPGSSKLLVFGDKESFDLLEKVNEFGWGTANLTKDHYFRLFKRSCSWTYQILKNSKNFSSRFLVQVSESNLRIK